MARRRRHAHSAHAPVATKQTLTSVPPTPRRRLLSRGATVALLALVATACLGARALRSAGAPALSITSGPPVAPLEDDAPSANGARARADTAPLAYAGRDAHRRPRYVQREFTEEERALLRGAFGITDPNRLWLPDSSDAAVLRYDGVGGIAARVGYRSWRRPGETWEDFVARIRGLDRRRWPAAARDSYHTGLRWLAPPERAAFEELLDSARAAGFRVRVAETYRAPERQAYLLAHGNGQTFTATSAHQYGRAADILVGDGRVDTRAKLREWARFRRWVLDWGQGRFRLVGTPWDTWDWPHVELAEPPVGFRSVDELLAAARRCAPQVRVTTDPADDPCALPPPERDGEHTSAGRIATGP
jgi:hypothetical protein